MHGDWSSPVAANVNGRMQVLFGGGDGWLRAYDAASGNEIWRFDGNPKDARWLPRASVFSRNAIIASPVFADGRVFTLGISGILSAFDAATGKLLWQKPAPAVETLYNNSAMSPIADRDAVILEVNDDGPGVPADVMDRIFSPFFTTKPQGSGLGLAIVRKIVDAHDGRIDVDSGPERMPTVRLSVPHWILIGAAVERARRR